MAESPAYHDSDGGTYCYLHAPQGVEPDGMPGETDSPEHCEVCQRPLEYSLTDEGVQYVLEYLDEPIDVTVYAVYAGTWYEGSPHVQIRLDWARDLRWYGLDEKDGERVVEFINAAELAIA